ncbi:MAG: aminotransferase class IV family protein [Opitutaceae bacterium]|nr:aminotransferase class IV family protein [Opitutaceae bacterium]
MENYIQANTGGELHDARTASISPLNRGFLYGDSIYEVWRTFEGVLVAFDEHWERLNHSANALGICLELSEKDLRNEIGRTIEAFQERSGWRDDCYVRFQMARGEGPLALDPTVSIDPIWVILVQRLKPLSEEFLEEGICLSIARELKRNPVDSLNPAWKTGNYLNNIVSLAEARRRGAQDVLMVNHQGAVCEASTSNVFFVKGKTLVTPLSDCGILNGVTRNIILNKLTLPEGIELREERIQVEELAEFDECFLTATLRDIVPVRNIDETRYTVSKDSVTRKVKWEYTEWLQSYRDSYGDSTF